MLNQMWHTIGDMDTDTKLVLPYKPCEPQIFCDLSIPGQCYRIDPCDPNAPPVPIEPSPPTDPPDIIEL